MMKNKSHGRLIPPFRLSGFIILIGMISLLALGAGIWIGRKQVIPLEKGLHESYQEQASIQARLLVDGFWKTVRLLKLEALQHKAKEDLLWWGEFALIPKPDSGVENSETPLAARLGHQIAGIETGSGSERASDLNELSRIPWKEILKNGLGMKVLNASQQGSGKFRIGFAFLNGEHSVAFAIVNSDSFMRVLSRVTPRKEEGIIRSYLIEETGRVLAHSRPAFAGSDFSHTDVFQKKVKELFRTSSAGKSASSKSGENGSEAFRAIDHLMVFAGVARPGSLPVAVVVERAGVKLGLPFLKAIRADLLGGLAIWALLTLFGAFTIWMKLRRVAPDLSVDTDRDAEEIARQLELESLETVGESMGESGRKLPNFSIPQVAELEKAMLQLNDSKAKRESLEAELEFSKAALSAYRKELAQAAQFEKEAVRLKAKEAVARSLVRSTSRICESPVLYFTCQPKTRSATLSFCAGFDGASEPTGMRFSLSDQLIRQIYEESKNAELVNIAQYEPLAEALVRNCGVAHYEAWAVTGYSYLGRKAGKLRLLGVLVILKAGTETLARRDSIGRMVRIAGLVYENALLSARQ